MADEPQLEEWRPSEALQVLRNRELEARRAGLSAAEARAFAASGLDVGQLRKLVAAGCPLSLMARILR